MPSFILANDGVNYHVARLMPKDAPNLIGIRSDSEIYVLQTWLSLLDGSNVNSIPVTVMLIANAGSNIPVVYRMEESTSVMDGIDYTRVRTSDPIVPASITLIADYRKVEPSKPERKLRLRKTLFSKPVSWDDLCTKLNLHQYHTENNLPDSFFEHLDTSTDRGDTITLPSVIDYLTDGPEEKAKAKRILSAIRWAINSGLKTDEPADIEPVYFIDIRKLFKE